MGFFQRDVWGYRFLFRIQFFEMISLPTVFSSSTAYAEISSPKIKRLWLEILSKFVWKKLANDLSKVIHIYKECKQMHTQIYMQLTRSLQMVVITDNGLGGLSVIDCIWQSITIYYRV